MNYAAFAADDDIDQQHRNDPQRTPEQDLPLAGFLDGPDEQPTQAHPRAGHEHQHAAA
jgi:hypothetical protein